MDSYTHDRRHSEPESVYDITFKVLAALMARERNKYNENTETENDGARIPGKG